MKVKGADLSLIEEFIFLGTVIRSESSTKEDIRNRLGKARNVFKSMINVWRSAQYGTNTKLKLYQSYVVSTILKKSECWKMTQTVLTKLCSFHTSYLHRILRIFSPEMIFNKDPL